MAGTQDDVVLQELHRAAILAERAGISIVSEDAARADRITGSRGRTKRALGRLAGAGRIVPVRRGVLALPDSAGLITTTLEELIAVIAHPPYLITGGRALQYHRLTDQHFFGAVVLTARPVSKFEWRGERATFLTTASERIWGGVPTRPPGPHRVRPLIATTERALLDAVNHPRYGVSLAQAFAALQLSLKRDSRFRARLAKATRRYESASTARRIGFLVERIAGREAAEPFFELIGNSPTPVDLRTTGPREGPVDNKWKVRVNADLELLRGVPA